MGNFSQYSIRHVLFAAALFTYAFFGSPTPDITSLTEIAIFILLFFAIRFDLKSFLPGDALLAYGLSVPVLVAFIDGNPIGNLIRDIVPFLFLLLPLFFRMHKSDANYIGFVVSAVGLLFSLRAIYDFGPDIWNVSSWLGAPPNLLYLANSPEVLFACVLLAGEGCRRFINQQKISGGFVLLASLLPLLAMMSAMQRASIAYIIFVMFWGFINLLWRSPAKALAALFVSSAIFIVLHPFLETLSDQLALKTRLVGLNSRVDEWAAVWGQVSSSLATLVLGMGWGAELENPAVGALRVNYTHSLLSALLLKTGLAGVGLFILYGAAMLKKAWPVLMERKIFLFALAGPLLIGFAFYASYKSLGYGLLLLLLSSLTRGKKLEQASPNMQ